MRVRACCAVALVCDQVMLFDSVGSTYLCILGEGNRNVQEFCRARCEDPWLRVERGDTTKTKIYQDAGVPKTIPWQGPTMVVYTHGKLDVCKGGAVCKSTRKFYQWCGVCCRAGCGNELEGCTKARCWVAPRKWKKHVESHSHISAFGINHRIAQERCRQEQARWQTRNEGMDVFAQSGSIPSSLGFYPMGRSAEGQSGHSSAFGDAVRMAHMDTPGHAASQMQLECASAGVLDFKSVLQGGIQTKNDNSAAAARGGTAHGGAAHGHGGGVPGRGGGAERGSGARGGGAHAGSLCGGMAGSAHVSQMGSGSHVHLQQQQRNSLERPPNPSHNTQLWHSQQHTQHHQQHHTYASSASRDGGGRGGGIMGMAGHMGGAGAGQMHPGLNAHVQAQLHSQMGASNAQLLSHMGVSSGGVSGASIADMMGIDARVGLPDAHVKPYSAASSSEQQQGNTVAGQRLGAFPFGVHECGGLGQWTATSSSSASSQAVLHISRVSADVHPKTNPAPPAPSSHRERPAGGMGGVEGAGGMGEDADSREWRACSDGGHTEGGADFDVTLQQVQQENVSLRAKVETLQSTLKKVVQGVGGQVRLSSRSFLHSHWVYFDTRRGLF